MKPNLQNRVSIWVVNLANVETSLLLAQRSRHWAETRPSTPDDRSMIYGYGSKDPYSDLRDRAFPTAFECDEIEHAAVTAAIVLYSQLLVSGNADGDRVASHSPHLKEQLWTWIYAMLQRDLHIPKADVEALNDTIREWRDTLVAHGDGNRDASFSAEGTFSSFGDVRSAWRGNVDIAMWLRVVYETKHRLGLLPMLHERSETETDRLVPPDVELVPEDIGGLKIVKTVDFKPAPPT